MKQSRISIIGAGSVGATTAFALIKQNIATEIMLVDSDDKRCSGEVLDLQDTLSFSATSRIIVGTPRQAGESDIIIIAAGARQNPGQPRTDLLAINKKIIHSIIESLQPIQKSAILIMVTNPVETLAFYAQQISGLPTNQVIGSGTLLDSLRLQSLIAHEIEVAQESVHAFILGEHGDAQFPAWSSAHIDGAQLSQFPALTNTVLEKIAQKARNRAYEIIACKGSTYFGIASCVAYICESILFDQKKVIPLSCYVPDFKIYLSMPAILGAQGIEQIVMPILKKQEQERLDQSVKSLKKMYASCQEG